MEYMHVDLPDLVCILFSSSPSFLLWWQSPGSLYFLVLMACARVRPQVRLLSGLSCGGLARLIHRPTGMTFYLKGKSRVTTDFHDRFSLWDPHQRRTYSCNCLYEKDLPSYNISFYHLFWRTFESTQLLTAPIWPQLTFSLTQFISTS